MTRIETARVNEVIGLKIGSVREAANKLSVNSDLQDLEADILALEKAVIELKETVETLPFKH